MRQTHTTLEFRRFASWTSLLDVYVIVPASFLVIITNACVIFVYWKKYRITINEIRKMSSILYIGIATANITAVIPTAVLYLYSFGFVHVTTYIPYDLCWWWNFLLKLPNIPHLSSIWFVTLLSVQRLMVIRHPFGSGKKWNTRRTTFSIIIIVIVSSLLQIPVVFGCKFTPLSLANFSNESNSTNDITCKVSYADWLSDSAIDTEFFILSFNLAVIILSALLILYCDFSLIAYLRSSSKVRHLLINTLNCTVSGGLIKSKLELLRDGTSKKHLTGKLELSENSHQILLIVVLSLIVFIVEIPYGIILSIYIYSAAAGIREPYEWYWIGPIRTMTDVSIVMSYPSLFILSCIFSRRFRALLWISCRREKKNKSSVRTCITDRTSVENSQRSA